MNKFRPLIESFFLLGVGSLAIYYDRTNQLGLLVNSRYNLLILLSSWTLVGLGIYELIRYLKKVTIHVHDQHADSWLRRGPGYLLIALTIGIGLLIPPQPLSSQTALSRGVSVDLPGIRSADGFRLSISPENRTLIDWIRTLQTDPEPDNHQGDPVRLTGFVMHAPHLPDNHFLIARFMISCCAADARPVALPVKYDPAQFTFENDQWISLEGQITAGQIQDERVAVIELTNMEFISTPINPYVQ